MSATDTDRTFAEGRTDIIARFWDGLALVLADDLAQHGPPPPV